MRPHYSQSNCENATSSGGTSQLASYKEVPPAPPPPSPGAYDFYLPLKIGYKQSTQSKVELKTLYFNFHSQLQNHFVRSVLEEKTNY